MKPANFLIPLFVLAVLLAPARDAVANGGLDELDDDRLLTELAGRGLTTLLERAFDVNQVPPDQREGIRSMVALQELARADHISELQRQTLISTIVGGIERVLPQMNDPQALSAQADMLVQYGVEPDVNTLEYWGENPRVQANLRPVVEAVRRMLDKAAELAAADAQRVEEQIQSIDDRFARRWQELNRLGQRARYARHMIDYYYVLAIDSQDPLRREIAQQGIEYLSQFDNPRSQVQPLVRLRIAKFHMLAGNFDEARAAFDSFSEQPPAIDPVPNPAQQYEAKYFTAVTDLLEGKIDQTQTRLDELIAWQQDNLLPEAHRDADAAAAMLQYRIHSARADAAGDDNEKQAANDQAVQVLLQLVQEQPSYRGLIFQQLIYRLPADPVPTELDPLLLQAMIQRGDRERLKTEDQPIDAAYIEHAIAAARELIARRDQPAIEQQMIDDAAIRIGFFFARLERFAEAAAAFIEYIDNFPDNQRNVQLAFEHAQALIGELRRTDPDDAATLRVYDRFLAIAVQPPFQRREFAFEYGHRLQSLGRHAEAAEIFRLVPQDDNRHNLARFFEMMSLQQHLARQELQIDEPARQAMMQQIQALADEVTSTAQAALAAAETDQQRNSQRLLLVRTALIAADLAKQEQPQRAIELLADFEQRVAGLGREDDLLGEALFIRVHSFMAMGRNTEATQALVRLLETREGGQGANIVFNLLQRLDQDLDNARQAANQQRIRELARSRAMLSGFLVEWARDHRDEDIRRYTYRYRLFDAATQHLAAQLEEDPARRIQGLQDALSRYQALQTSEAVAMYRQTIDPDSSTDPEKPDPAVLHGLALIHFDLGNYAEAQPLLGRLLSDRRLGTPVQAVEEHGELRLVDNDQYWEGQYKLLRSNVELARLDPQQHGPALEASRGHLTMLYIREGDRVGGQRWKQHFEALRREILPNLDVQALIGPAEPIATN